MDNKFHVEGELKVANREQVNNLMKLINPLLTCLPGAKVLLVSCLPRFMHSGCCASEGHMVDFDKAKLVADLVSMKKTIRSILFGAKLKNVRVVDPATICATDDPENWEDTVHLRWEQYVKLAAGLSGMLAGVKGAEETGEVANDTPDPKRVRLLSSVVPAGAGGFPTSGGRDWGGRGG